jgi:hypothetical protein
MFSSDRERFDIGFVTWALRSHPDDFAMQGARVLHLPSGLQFTFAPTVHTKALNLFKPRPISLVCFQAKEEPDLYQAFQQWHSSYWQIIERNEQADSPFIRRRWKRLTRMIKAALRGFGDTPDLPIIPGA